MKTRIFYFMMALLLSPSIQANLLVTPTRVELDNQKERSAVFSLVNKGTTTSRYDVYFEEKRMTATGEFITLGKDEFKNLSKDSPNAILLTDMQSKSIAKYVRYSPRRLSLEPEQGGRVRLALRAPKNLPEGEYRSYIVFHQIPLAPTSNATQHTAQGQSLSLTISAFMKIAIPVILRVGDLSAQVDMKTLGTGWVDGLQSVQVTITRQGERSSYGDLEVYHGQTGQLLGSLKNAAVYSELESKVFSVPLTQTVTQGTELRISYRESDTLFEPKQIETQIVF
jgi:fimbrial chaperone protein